MKRHDVRGCECGHTAYDHDSALICLPCEEAVRVAADALADAASNPCNCFDGQLDWAYKQHNEPTSGTDDCPVQAAVDAYRKARGDA